MADGEAGANGTFKRLHIRTSHSMCCRLQRLPFWHFENHTFTIYQFELIVNGVAQNNKNH